MSPPVLFLSHAGADTEAALALADQIEASPAARQHGLKVWIDKRCLIPGTSWQEQLEDAITNGSSAFGVYLTKAGSENWVRFEVRSALDRVISAHRKGTTYPFIPIVADDPVDIGRLPPFAQQYQGVSLKEDAGLQKLVAAILGVSSEKPLPLIEEPFRGLEAFGSEDAALFFGRDHETRELLSRLRETSLLLVVGDSGSGKSSLVKAGLVPAFKEGLLADPRAPRPDIKSWHVVQMRPLSSPLEELIGGISDAARSVVGVNAALLNEAYSRLRKKDSTAMIDALREGVPVDARVLLVIDQFEELWTQTVDAASRDAFLDGVLDATRLPNLRIRVVATMRRDYFFQIASHNGWRQYLDAASLQSRYNLRRMTDAQLRECIEEPLALAGVGTAEASSLADEVLRDAGDEPGDLALIEMALFKTWQERSKHATLLDAYKAIGRVEGALGQAADEALDKLVKQMGDDGYSLAETIFVRLVTQSPDGGITRRVGQRSEFTTKAWEVAQRFATREYNRLLVLGRSDSRVPREAIEEREMVTPESSPTSAATAAAAAPNSPYDAAAMTAELAHEQLATQWAQYLRWLRASAAVADDKRALDRLVDRVQAWVAGGKRFWDVTASRSEKLEFNGLRKRRPGWLSEEEREFVDRLRRRNVTTLIAAGFAGVALLAAVAWALISQQIRLNEAHATNIWNRLTLTSDFGPSEQEAKALRELRATPPSVKLAFAMRLRTDSGLADRFNRNPLAVTRSLVATDLPLRDQLVERVVAPPLPVDADPVELEAIALLGASLETPRAIEPLLKSIAATSNPDKAGTLDQWLAALANKLDAKQAAQAVEPLLRSIAATSDWLQLAVLGRGLAALAGKLDGEQAARAIEPLLKRLGRMTEPRQQAALGRGLAALASKLDAKQAAQAVEALRQSIELASHLDQSVALWTLGRGLAALAGKLDGEQAARAVEPLLRSIAATSDPDRDAALSLTSDLDYSAALRTLGQGLAALAGKLDGEQAARAVELLLRSVAATSDSEQLAALGQGLAALWSKLDSGQAARAVEPLLKSIAATRDPDQLRKLGQAFAGLRLEFSAEQAARAFEPSLKRFGPMNQGQLLTLGQGLAPLAGKLNSEQAARAVELLLNSLAPTLNPPDRRRLHQWWLAVFTGKPDGEQAAWAVEVLLRSTAETIDPDELATLGLGLAALPMQLSAEQAARAIEPLLRRIAATSNRSQLGALGQGLAALAGKLDGEQAARAIEPLLKRIAATSNADQLAALGQGLAALAAKLDGEQAARAVELLLRSLAATSDSEQLAALGQGLAGLRLGLSAEQVARGVGPLLEGIMQTSDAGQLRKLGQGLAALAGRLSAEQATEAVEVLRKSIELASQLNQRAAIATLGQGLAALAGKLDGEQAARAVEPLLHSIAATSDPEQFAALGQGLAALASKLDAKQAAQTVEELLKQIAWRSNRGQLGALGQGLAALAGKLDGEQAGRAVESLLKSIAATSDRFQLAALGRGLVALTDRVQNPDLAGRSIVEALTNPFADARTTEVLIGALRKRFPGEIPEQAGLWDVFAWNASRPTKARASERREETRYRKTNQLAQA